MRLPLAERMTDRAFKAMIPLYVRGPEGSDHKCGGCNMRVELDGDRAYCTVVQGEISLARGTCNYWAEGRKGSEFEDIHEKRMPKGSAGYVEFKGAINCGSCDFIGGAGKDDSSIRRCKLWMSDVGPGDCCISWEEKLRHRTLSEKWSHALDEGVGAAFTDRYDALGMDLPNPKTMCKGECEGTGCVPTCIDDPDLRVEPWKSLWAQAELDSPRHTGDRWHFLKCPACRGTGLAQPHEAHVAKMAEAADGDTSSVRKAKARVAEMLRRH